MHQRCVSSWGYGSAAILGLLGFLAVGSGALASDDPNGALSKDEQKCVVEINKNAAKVAKAQGKRICKCIKDGAKGKLLGQTIEECVADPANAKVTKVTGKLKTKVGAKCAGQTPGFGVDPNGIDPNSIIAAALESGFELIHEIFGSNLDAAILPKKDPNDPSVKPTSKCQLNVAKATKKCLDTRWKVFTKCKKNGLKGKDPPGAIDSAGDLETLCLQDPNGVTGQPDLKGKIKKVCVTKLQAKIDKKCAGVDLDRAFPGLPEGLPLSRAVPRPHFSTLDVLKFMDEAAKRAFVQQVNATDELQVDCDLFDDGIANGSCASGAVLGHFKFYETSPVGCEDPTRTNFVGGPNTGFGGGACRSLSDQATCEVSWHLGFLGPGSCVWQAPNEVEGCFGCKGDNQQGPCTNTCAEVPEQTISLIDQFFNDPVVELDFRFGLGNPVEKSVGVCVGGDNDGDLCVENPDCPGGSCTDVSITPIVDPAAHMLTYVLGQAGLERLSKFIAVEFSNQFGDGQRAIVDSDGAQLLVPARKNGLGPSATLDHYRCYSAKFEDAVEGTVRLADQFVDETVVIGGVSFCNPVDKNGEGIRNAAGHLACYGLQSSFSDPNLTVSVGDQFDADAELQVVRVLELCVPSEKLDVGLCGDGVVGGPITGFENCEATDDSACPGRCGPDCHCGPECPGDPTRTVYAGGLDAEACRQFTNQASCEVAYHLGELGAASCFWDVTEPVCVGCGGNNGEPCTNTCEPPPSCEGDPTRTNFVGGPETGDDPNDAGACRAITDQTTCENSWHLGLEGVGACIWDASQVCVGCNGGGNAFGACTDPCDDPPPPPPCGDPSRTNFVGGPFTGLSGGACKSLTDEASCETAYHLGEPEQAASCWWAPYEGCLGCGLSHEKDDHCANTCRQ